MRKFEFLNFRIFEFSNFRIAVCRVRNGDWKGKNPESRKFEKSGGETEKRENSIFRIFEFSNFACRARKDVWKAKNPKSRKFGKV